MKQALQVALVRLMFRPLLGWRGDGAAVPGNPVNFPSMDGSRLDGVLLPAPAMSQAKGTVILCHPFLKYGWRYFARSGLAGSLATAGYDVLMFDFKGFGRSELKGPTFADDVRGAAAYAAARTPERPLYLVGTSFGGYHAAHALAQGLDGKIAAVVLDSVPPGVDRFFRTGAVGAAMRGLGRSRWRQETGTAPLAEAMTEVWRTPVLMLFGDRDRCLRPGDLEAIRALPRARTVVFSGCGHLEAFKTHPRDYLRQVTSFLAEHAKMTEEHRT